MRYTAMALVLALLAGCALPGGAASSQSASASVLAGETVSGIITQVNGNEITLDLVTLAGEGAASPGEEETADRETPAPQENERPAGGRGNGSRGEAPSGGRGEGMPSPPSGGSGSPAFGEGGPAGEAGNGGGSASRRGYARTGETALYQIPVGAEVITLTGASRGFNSLSTDLLVTIIFREDGETPAQVQVIQSLS